MTAYRPNTMCIVLAMRRRDNSLLDDVHHDIGQFHEHWLHVFLNTICDLGKSVLLVDVIEVVVIYKGMKASLLLSRPNSYLQKPTAPEPNTRKYPRC